MLQMFQSQLPPKSMVVFVSNLSIEDPYFPMYASRGRPLTTGQIESLLKLHTLGYSHQSVVFEALCSVLEFTNQALRVADPIYYGHLMSLFPNTCITPYMGNGDLRVRFETGLLMTICRRLTKIANPQTKRITYQNLCDAILDNPEFPILKALMFVSAENPPATGQVPMVRMPQSPPRLRIIETPQSPPKKASFKMPQVPMIKMPQSPARVPIVKMPQSPLRVPIVKMPQSPLRVPIVKMPQSPARIASPRSPPRITSPQTLPRTASPRTPPRIASPQSPPRVGAFNTGSQSDTRVFPNGIPPKAPLVRSPDYTRARRSSPSSPGANPTLSAAASPQGVLPIYEGREIRQAAGLMEFQNNKFDQPRNSFEYPPESNAHLPLYGEKSETYELRNLDAILPSSARRLTPQSPTRQGWTSDLITTHTWGIASLHPVYGESSPRPITSYPSSRAGSPVTLNDIDMQEY